MPACGKPQVRIERDIPLAQAPEALCPGEAGRVSGKLVIAAWRVIRP